MHALRSLVAPLVVLLLAVPASADQVSILGSHELSGHRGTDKFTGSFDVAEDATFTGERRFASGKKETLAGTVSVDRDALVLTDATAVGVVGALAGAASTKAEPRRFVRGERGDKVVWRHAAGELAEEIVAGEKETKLEMLLRAAKVGRAANYLLNGNRGFVDPDPERRILRSKEPTADDIVRLAREKGVKTVLSLNGDLDKTGWLHGEDRERPAEKVKLNDLIAREGLRHESFRMSAKAAPTDEELVAIFKVLLDDSKKPILVHCLGGSDRTGIVAALYAIEFLGTSKEDAKKVMRDHMWASHDGTEIQGVYLDLYRTGHLRALLEKAGVALPRQ
ncbi:MAG: tyrosine-protein phosphatase [Planctomycetota bacterium]